MNVESFFKRIWDFPHFCKGCGLCAGLCPTGAVRMVFNSFGESLPYWNEKECIDCGMCSQYCPGARLPIYNGPQPFGHNLGIFLGHAVDKKFRCCGSSGGVITALLSFGLDKQIFKKVLTLRPKSGSILSEACIVHSGEEIRSCAGSKYVAAPLLEKVQQAGSQAALTALPCHAAAYRACFPSDGFIFGLFCSRCITPVGIRYFLNREGLREGDLLAIRYRTGSWPGFTEIVCSEKTIRIPNNRSVFSAIFNSHLFSPAGCLMCSDYFCSHADISFGDPWMRGYRPGGMGDTVIISRSEKGDNLLQNAVEAGVIRISPLDPSMIYNGHILQIRAKSIGVRNRVLLLKRLGIPYPDSSEVPYSRRISVGALLEAFYLVNVFAVRKYGIFKHLLRVPGGVLYAYRFGHAFLYHFWYKYVVNSIF